MNIKLGNLRIQIYLPFFKWWIYKQPPKPECSKSWNDKYHQRRNTRPEKKTGIIYRVKPYCWYCGKFVTKGDDTPISGDQPWSWTNYKTTPYKLS